MKPDHFELFCNFTARHGRFLKKSETSFTPKELDLGVKLAEKCVKAIVVVCKKMTPEEMKEAIHDSAKSKKIASEAKKKIGKVNPKQLLFIVNHFEKFQSAVSHANAAGTPAAKVKRDAEFGDRYYAPKEHKYR